MFRSDIVPLLSHISPNSLSTQIPLSPLPSELYATVSAHLSVLLAPAQRYIQSFEAGGAQEKFAEKLWEKTKDGEALGMMKGAAKTLWDSVQNGGGKDGGGSGGKGGSDPSGGGGGSGPVPE